MRDLTTRWSDAAAAGQTLLEYPRPQLQRERWMCLNGLWNYRIEAASGETVCEGEIHVPFAPESALSGVGHILQPDECLVYTARLELPQGLRRRPTDRVLLHLGAVDQCCSLQVNGQPVGTHSGGYTAFTFDITHALVKGANTLELRVHDRTESAPYGRGKQRIDHNIQYSSLFYTPVSGIWKTVWLECVPSVYVTDLRITPRYDAAKAIIRVGTNVPAAGSVEILLHGQSVTRQAFKAGQQELEIPLPGFEAWSPEHPTLYDVWVRVGEDVVRSYLGMRKIESRRDAQGILRFYLNDEPIFLNGVLDQGYWPDGILTAPSDEAFLYDIERLHDMGYNLIRKHIKVEPERFYYHCDRLGMLVWQDMPNGGGNYNMSYVATLPNAIPWAGRHIRDDHYRWFAREDAQGRQIYYQELEEIIHELYNHPSLVIRIPIR